MMVLQRKIFRPAQESGEPAAAKGIMSAAARCMATAACVTELLPGAEFRFANFKARQ
jgi:hypothetical protein